MQIRPFSWGVVAILLAIPSVARGQHTESVAAQERADCRLAAQIIRTGHPAPHREWAYGIIPQCNLTGPSALAARWAVATDSLELELLTTASARLPSRIIFDASAAAAVRSTHSLTRINAMILLADFASPAVGLSPWDVRHPTPGRPPMLVATSGARPTIGEWGDVRADVVAVMAEVWCSPADSEVRRIAGVYFRYLSGEQPERCS